MTYRTRLARVTAALNHSGARYVLVGAQAGILWGHVRATRDIDILIEATPDNARCVIAALGALDCMLARELSPEDLAARPVTVFTDPAFRIDILTVAWSVHHAEAQARAATFAVEGVPIPTISIEDLITSKRTGRLQDAADIEALEEIRRIRGSPPGGASGGTS